MSNFDFSAYTESVINATGANASPRVKKVMPILIRKLHEFCIEADVTLEEWMATCNFLVEAGQVSSDARNEVVLVSDVLGVESLVDTLDQTRAQRANAVSENGEKPDFSFSAILGPFYRSGVPVQPNGTTIVRQEEPGAPYCHLFGTIHGADGTPLPNALVDIWHDAPDGLYDSQTPEKPLYHCRGRFRTDENGAFDTMFETDPLPYSIRFPSRSIIDHARPTSLPTSSYSHLKDDSVFAVKDQLVVTFKPVSKSYQAPAELEGKVLYELQQDFTLHKADGKSSVEVEGPSL